MNKKYLALSGLLVIILALVAILWVYPKQHHNNPSHKNSSTPAREQPSDTTQVHHTAPSHILVLSHHPEVILANHAFLSQEDAPIWVFISKAKKDHYANTYYKTIEVDDILDYQKLQEALEKAPLDPQKIAHILATPTGKLAQHAATMRETYQVPNGPRPATLAWFAQQEKPQAIPHTPTSPENLKAYEVDIILQHNQVAEIHIYHLSHHPEPYCQTLTPIPPTPENAPLYTAIQAKASALLPHITDTIGGLSLRFITQDNHTYNIIAARPYPQFFASDAANASFARFTKRQQTQQNHVYVCYYPPSVPIPDIDEDQATYTIDLTKLQKEHDNLRKKDNHYPSFSFFKLQGNLKKEIQSLKAQLTLNERFVIEIVHPNPTRIANALALLHKHNIVDPYITKDGARYTDSLLLNLITSRLPTQQTNTTTDDKQHNPQAHQQEAPMDFLAAFLARKETQEAIKTIAGCALLLGFVFILTK